MAVLALVVAGAFGSALLRDRNSHSEVESVASRFASALLTYDSGDLDRSRSRIRPLVTDKFFANYDSTLKALAEVNAKAEGRAVEILVGRPQGGRVSAIAVTDSEAQTTNGPRRNSGTHLRLYLVRQEGAWRVDSVVELSPGRSESPPEPAQP